MLLTVENVHTSAQGTAEELDWLHTTLVYRDPTARFRANAQERVPLFDRRRCRFPSGLVSLAVRRAAKEGLALDVRDARPPPPALRDRPNIRWLYEYQEEAVEACIAAGRGIVQVPTGGGKCLGLGTPVMLFDGRVIPVEAVRPGDQLMGPDSRPRNVLRTTRGRSPLYRVTPTKGDPWVCNDVHVLTLVNTTTGKVLDVDLPDYLDTSATFKHLHKQFAVGVDFPPVPPPVVDPYFLGVWLGDGGKDYERNGVRISKGDPEILACMQATAAAWGLRVETYSGQSCPTHRIVGTPKVPNPLRNALRACVSEDFVVAPAYLLGSRETRAELLAGLLDTDGHHAHGGYDFVQKRKPIADAVVWLARSLGLRAYLRPKIVAGYGEYWRVSISGDCTHLPLRIARKRPVARAHKKNVLRTAFALAPIGEGEYAGFTLDGDGRFLLGDFTVTHNTEVFGAVVHLVPCRWLVFVHRADLMHQAAERIERRTGEPCGLWGDGVFRPGRVIVATFKTVALALAARERVALRMCADAEGVVVDEVHVLGGDEAYRVLNACPNAFYRFGFSGTPLSRSDRKGALVIAATGEIIYKMKAAALVAAGVVAQPTVHLVPCAVKPDPTRDYRTAHTGAMTAHHRERMAVAILKRAPKPCIAFIRDIAHGESLEVAVRAAGFRTELVSGRNPTKQRQASIRRVAEGETDVLISSVVFQEGIDLPELKSVALLAGGKSHIAALQNIGRGMRRKDRFGRVVKDAVPIFELTDTPCGTCEVLDRVTGENHYRHSLCRWVHAHAKERRRAYRGAGYPLVEGIP